MLGEHDRRAARLPSRDVVRDRAAAAGWGGGMLWGLAVLVVAGSAGRAGADSVWRFPHALYNVSVAENSPPRTYCQQPPDEEPLGLRAPGPEWTVRFRIRLGDRDKFFKPEERRVGDFYFVWLRTRSGRADVLNRERRDSYLLEVRATAESEGREPLETDTAVAVTVLDRDDLEPLFVPAAYQVDVPEDAPAHSSVARVTAEDADLGLAGQIYYSLERPAGPFAVHPTSGVVRLTRPLSRAECEEYSLTVLARDRGPPSERDEPARAELVVRVHAVNLHAPEVRAVPISSEEDARTVAALVVTDRDEGRAGRLASVEIVKGDPGGHFLLVAGSGAQELRVILHPLLPPPRDVRDYNLTVCATDAGVPARRGYGAVSGRIGGRSDGAGVFAREIYSAVVPETAPPGTPVVRLRAAGPDREARVHFEIVGGNEGGEFRVNADTGMLYTAVELDAERRATYTLTVAAVDRGPGGARAQSSAKVAVEVQDENDNEPVFETDAVDVDLPENLPAGAEVYRARARDADSGDNGRVSYSLAGTEPQPFEIDPLTGVVRTARLLDYEGDRREYRLTVRAGDWGVPFRRAAELRLAVRLQDVNDNRPQFERDSCRAWLPRDAAPGRVLVTLSALDPDAGDEVAYRAVAGHEDGCLSVDAVSGAVTTGAGPECARAVRVLNVTATDGTHFSDVAAVTVLPADLHDGPVRPAECRDTGAVRRLSALLSAARRYNEPPQQDDPPPASPPDNAHAPVFVDFPIELKVNESVSVGATLVTLRARDPDLGYSGLLTFLVADGDPDSAFRLEPHSGRLQVLARLDRGRRDMYLLNVSVLDAGRPRRAASRVLPVLVLDDNDHAPEFRESVAAARLPESALVGTEVFVAQADDRDAGDYGHVQYSLEGDGDGVFCVSERGAVTVCGVLDRETRDVHDLRVVAVDGGGRSARAALRVTVDDVNDCAPEFPRQTYSARLPEDVPPGTLVALLSARDPDEGRGGRVSYRLEVPDDALEVDEDSGAVRTVRRLDYETRQVHGVTVVATDGGSPPLESRAALVLELTDVDENLYSPEFAVRVLRGRVRENAPAGAHVMTARATDRDPPGRDSRLTYYLAGGGAALFAVDDAGDVRTLAPLDRELTARHWLTVCAQDAGAVSRHACVPALVDVLDENDEAPWPSRPLYTASVTENCPAGTSVVQVQAEDRDEDAHLTYRLTAGNPDGLFAVDERTGLVTATGRRLDREATDLHSLEVRVSDGDLTGDARVLVRVLDENDNAPRFSDNVYDLHVPGDVAGGGGDGRSGEGNSDEDDNELEGAASGVWDMWEGQGKEGEVYVGGVLAVDVDEGHNGSVEYSWRGDGLMVHKRSGRVYARAGVGPARLHAVVRACDAGRPPLCTVSRVSVSTVPPAPPSHGPPPLPAAPPSTTVAELDAPGFLVAALRPAGARAPLYYDIADGDPAGDFYVGRETGHLVLARRLQWERRPEYSLVLTAEDGRRTGSAVLNVTVVDDRAERAVTFERDHYEVEVDEQARAGELVLRLQATGGAAGAGGGRLLYGLAGGRGRHSARLFRLGEHTGELTLHAPPGPPGVHLLTVWARDLAVRTSRGYARVTVHVRGGGAPVWGRRLQSVRVGAGAGSGTRVGRVRAELRGGGDVRYSLTEDAGGLFSVGAEGDVRVTRELPATPREYGLLVRAAPAQTDAGPASSSTLALRVLVEPRALPPNFAPGPLETSVPESAPLGRPLLQVTAESSSWLQFSLAPPEAPFSLEPLSGVVTVAGQLDYESDNFYNLTVRATDLDGASAEIALLVRVLDVNEHPPRLLRTEYRGRVSEDALPGQLVVSELGSEPLVLSVVDLDGPAHRRHIYRLSPPAAAALFTVDSVTGALLLAGRVDRELTEYHNFTVEVLDGDTPRRPADSVAAISVRVEGVDDCAPELERTEMRADLVLPAVDGQIVVKVGARDPDDPPASLLWDLAAGNDDEAFTVDAAGLVTVAHPALLTPRRELVVQVSDGRHESRASLLVRSRVPEPAGLAFTRVLYEGSVRENSLREDVVCVLSAVGTALHEPVEYRLAAPSSHFSLGSSSGVLRTTGVPLDRERAARLELAAEVRAGRRTARAIVVVTVLDENDNCPEFASTSYLAAVEAGAPAGTSVARVEAADRDAGELGEVRYEMARGHGELFAVERSSGLVSMRRAAEERDEPHELTVAAYDGGSPACRAEVRLAVRVWPGGAAPRWTLAHYTLEAREDTATGARLSELGALSPLRRPLLYSIRSDPDDMFYLHYDTVPAGALYPCALVLRSPLDYETRRSHTLVVRATDGVTGAHADVDVTLTVLDVNDCPPRFDRELYRAEIYEDAPVGSVLLAAGVTDQDSGPARCDLTEDMSALFEVRGTPAGCELVLTRVLDRELTAEHRLLLTATDRGDPPLTARAALLVRVLDVNDNAPRPERAVVTAAVSPEAPRGLPVARAAAADPDGATLEYSLATPDCPFSVDPHSGLVTLEDPAAWTAARHPLSLDAVASDGARAARVRVELSPAPANRHAPTFERPLYEASVPENASPPSSLVAVRALDPDAGRYGAVSYSIPSQRLRETFSLDARTGELSALASLDREERAVWLVPVVAEDGGGLRGHGEVRVRVLDRNDCAPRFLHAEYCATAPQDALPAAPLVTVVATDPDEGEAGRVRYSLCSSGADESVAIPLVHEHNGEVSAGTAPAGASSWWVCATDGGGREARVQLRLWRDVSVPSALQSPPPDYSLPESAHPGTLVARLPPPARPSSARYRVVGGDHPPDMFSVDREGRVTLTGTLDRETAALHHIGVTVEGDEHSAGCVMWQARLHVLDVDEHAPQLDSAQYRLTVAENSPVGARLVRVMADDRDGHGSDVRYWLEQAGPALALRVDPVSGWVSTARSLDREAGDLELRATVWAGGTAGPGGPASSAPLEMIVLDYDDEPPVFTQRHYRATVTEDALPGTVVARLEYSDADSQATRVQYYIVEGDPAGQLAVRPSGEVYVAGGLDRELCPLYNLTVLLTDGHSSDTALLLLTVTDVNDNPPVCERLAVECEVPEDAPVGLELMRPTVTDRDEPRHARAKYHLTGVGAELFRAHKDTGAVTIAAALDRETAARHSLTLHVTDRARDDWGCTVTLDVRVTDVNDHPPTFPAPRVPAALPEDAEPGALVAVLHARDQDAGPAGRVTYSLLDHTALFTVDETSGAVTLRGALDRETRADYELRVRASDAGEPPLASVVLLALSVIDVNDNPPEFRSRHYRASVPELDAVGTEVARLEAISRDAGRNADVTYSIADGDGATDFIVDPSTGVVSVARPLDRESRAEYSLTVLAVDGGEPPLSDRATLDVTVLDVNDNAPRFSRDRYLVRVSEDAPVGHTVVRVEASDADSGENARVQYLAGGGDPAGQFSVDATTGDLTLTGPLDRELRDVYELVVRARDGGRPALEASVLVSVLVVDVNDCPPRLSRAHYEVAVREDEPAGAVVLQLEVTDEDAAPNAGPFTFDLTEGAGSFRVESDGRVCTAGPLSRKLRPRHELRVRVFDNGSPPLYTDARITVLVLEQSRYPPAVTPLEVTIISYRDEYPGGIIGRVFATDRDRLERLHYSLVSHSDRPDTAVLFDIDPHDGTLSAVARLPPGRYRLNATVSDGRFSGHATVDVLADTVTDADLQQAVVVRFREVTPREFVLAHRRGFTRAARTLLGGLEPRVLSVQEAGVHLDVLIAAADGETLRRGLHAHLPALEAAARLVLDKLPRAACGGCGGGRCRERAVLSGPPRAVYADVVSLVAPGHRLEARCECGPGRAGAHCELSAPGAAGGVLVLSGAGYLQYEIQPGPLHARRTPHDELRVSLRMRTRSDAGTLLYVAGLIDYNVLEIVEGRVQFRMELGSGAVAVRAGPRVSDGVWHRVQLERRGNSARLTVDEHVAHGRSPGPARRLDGPTQLVLGARGVDTVSVGLVGCLSELRVSGDALPLPGEPPSSDARLLRHEHVSPAPACPPLAAPTPCSSQPCLHGGECSLLGEQWSCSCPARYSGGRCELDLEPCAGTPCLHGGLCREVSEEPGYLCECAAGLSGTRCELGRWCRAGVCLHGGSCEEGEVGPSCWCGGTGHYGPRCQLDVDECAGEPCVAGARCVNEPGSYRCECGPDDDPVTCGPPPLTDAVLDGGLWPRVAAWSRAQPWWLWAGGVALLLAVLGVTLTAALLCRRRAAPPQPAPAVAPPPDTKPTKLSNLEARPPLNNAPRDTLRSYGAAGDELEVPRDYLRNLNLDPEHKPWSEQMHLHSFRDHKIHNDLKSPALPALARRDNRWPDARLVGGYHWDCSDWCGPTAGGVAEVPHSERPDSSENNRSGELLSSCADDEDFHASQYLLHPDSYLQQHATDDIDDTASIATAERRSLLAGGSCSGSCSSVSRRVCQIEESDGEPDGPTPQRSPTTHTAV